MRQIILTLTLITISSLTTSCNTMEGMGQDIQAGGKKLERSAERNKPGN